MWKKSKLGYLLVVMVSLCQFACMSDSRSSQKEASEPLTTTISPTFRDFSTGPDFLFVVDNLGRLLKITAGGERSEIIDANGNTRQVYFLNRQVGWTLKDNYEVFATHDGGRTWEKKGVVENDASSEVHFGRMRFVTEKTGWFQNISGIWKTTDGGVNWSRVYPTKTFSYATLGAQPLHLSIPEESVAWVGMTNGKLIVTRNGGVSWEQVQLPFASDVSSLFCANETRCWVGTRWKDRGVYSTTDGGNTWSQILPEEFRNTVNVSSISFPNAHVGWVTGFKSIPDTNKVLGVALRTTDGGNTWEELKDQPFDLLVDFISFSDDQNGWLTAALANDDNAIYHTADGGQKWLKIHTLD